MGIKTKKCVFILFLMILILANLYPENSRLKKDKILDYAYNRLSTTKSINNGYIHDLALFYIKLGHYDKAIEIFDILTDEYYKYSLLMELLYESNRFDEANFKKILKASNKISEPAFTTDLFTISVLAYLQRNDKENALAMLEKTLKMAQVEDFDGFILLFKLINPFIEKGLMKKAEGILLHCENLAVKNKDFFSIVRIIKEYHNLDKKKKVEKLLQKIEDEINGIDNKCDKVAYSIDYIMLLFDIEDFKHAVKQIQKAFNYCKYLSDPDNKICCLKELLEASEKEEFFSNVLLWQSEFEEYLIQNILPILSKIKDRSSASIFKRDAIKFLVKKGKYVKAIEIASRLDEEDVLLNKGSHYYKDYYYYYLGKKYLKYSQIKAKALNAADKITHYPMFKIELLLGVAESYDSDEPNGQALEIVNRARQILIEDKWERDEALGKIAMFCIKIGNYKTALQIIERVDYHRTRSALIFEVAQSNIRECKVHLAKQLIDRYEPDITFKAYIVSKIAAKLMVDGKKNEAEEMFKKAIDLILAANSGSLEVILKDYFYAREYGRLTTYNAWERLHFIE